MLPHVSLCVWCVPWLGAEGGDVRVAVAIVCVCLLLCVCVMEKKDR